MKTFIGLIIPLVLSVTWDVAGPEYAIYVIGGAAVLMCGVGLYDLVEGRLHRRRGLNKTRTDSIEG